MEIFRHPSSPTTGYVRAPSTPTNESDTTKPPSPMMGTFVSRRRTMLGSIGILSMIVLLRTYIYTHGTLDDVRYSGATTNLRIQTQSNFNSNSNYNNNNTLSWMDRIVMRRTMLADVSHRLQAMAHDRKRNQEKASSGSSSAMDDDVMVDLSILKKAVTETVHDIGVRGLLFEVLSDDFEYYVYSDESNDSEEYDDDNSEIDAYWEHCYYTHGVGKRCDEWDVWWTYHFIGAILTDMLLNDRELLWDGSVSSGERITINKNDDEGADVAMATLLDKIHSLQASLPYVTQSSFHAQHALIWRYVEKSLGGRLSQSYPWELALNFCRGDGSRPKGINGRPVNKGIDHECFHGFGHAMFYAVASKQLQQEQQQKEKGYLFLRPHSGFELSPESYCEIHELCRGASPPAKERKAMDPNDEASGNSYRICFEGVVHSVRLLSDGSRQMTNKDKAIDFVTDKMKRCNRNTKQKTGK